MKKFLAMLLTALVAVMPMASLAEPAEITWDRSILTSLDLEGDTYELEGLGLMIWIPASMEYSSPDDEEADKGMYCAFSNDECILIIREIEEAGLTVEQVYENAEANEAKDLEYVILNGMLAVSYEDENFGELVLVDDAGKAIIFAFSPIDTDESQTLAAIIFSSIMTVD